MAWQSARWRLAATQCPLHPILEALMFHQLCPLALAATIQVIAPCGCQRVPPLHGLLGGSTRLWRSCLHSLPLRTDRMLVCGSLQSGLHQHVDDGEPDQHASYSWV